MKSRNMSLFTSITEDIGLTRKNNPANFKMGIIILSLGWLMFLALFFTDGFSAVMVKVPGDMGYYKVAFPIIYVFAMVMVLVKGLRLIMKHGVDKR